jgi:GH15 family glucan-1,4-alpha-glucosidase
MFASLPSTGVKMEKIQDYGAIGDCRSVALVSKTGALDWLCWPRFDSPPIFANILDENQGQWKICPVEAYQSSQEYVNHTVILETRFSTSSGKVILTDLMPVASEEKKRHLLLPERELIRKVRCLEGKMDLRLTFSLCHQKRLYSKHRNLGIRSNINSGVLIFASSIKLNYQDNLIEETFTIHEGEMVYFSLSFSTEAPAVLPILNHTIEEVISRSVRYWKKFSSQITYQGSYKEAVIRSALVLKLMNHAPSGAIIASSTTSLPEKIGGPLNWDYRYCWLRDASLTIDALLNVGLREEAQSFVSWLLHTTNLTRPKLKVLYDVYGRKPQKEKTLKGFKGYMNSEPVKVGNQAYEQEQLDIYGEVICGAASVLSDAKEIDSDTQRMLKQFGQYICKNWAEEDSGMWEVRGRKEHFTHSVLLCWSGLQALLKLSHKGQLKNLDVERIQTTSQKMAKAIDGLAWNQQLETFTSTLRGTDLDANLLLLSWYKFPTESKRLEKTYQAIQRYLSAENKLLFRNRDMNEGVFILCSLWAVQYLAQGGGALKEAQELFEYILSYTNEEGLLSEELDPATGDLLGNFPLAFTHSGIINAAVAIENRERQEGLTVGAGRIAI